MVGTLPLNLHKTETESSQIKAKRAPCESNEPANWNEDASLPPDDFVVSDANTDSEGEANRSWNNTAHDLFDQARKDKKTFRSENPFPAGRNDRNVNWQDLFYLTNRKTSLLGSFGTV